MSEIHRAKASFSFLPVILGLGGLAGGIALTGVAARLLKNNAIWWAALPAGLVGYGVGHLAGKAEQGQKELEERCAKLKEEHEAKQAELKEVGAKKAELQKTRAELQKRRKALRKEFKALRKALEDHRHNRRSAPERLIRAASLGKYAEVKQALEARRLDPSAVVGVTALHAAVRKNDLEMVKLHLPYCKDVNRVCGGKRAIHDAILAQNAEVCRLLLDNGAVLSDTDRWEGSPYLYHAVIRADTATLETIVDHVENIDVTDEEGWTAARLAALLNRVCPLEILLAHGARLQRADFSDKEWEGLTTEMREKILGTALTEQRG